MTPPPPKLPAAGCVTAKANATPIAASTALPPRFMISTPTFEAISLVAATMPWRARTGSRDAANVETLEWLWRINDAVMAIERKAVVIDRKACNEVSTGSDSDRVRRRDRRE